MDRYFVLVWDKRNQHKCLPINLDDDVLGMAANLNTFLRHDDEIWVLVRAKNPIEASKKAKILWELT